MVFSSTEFLWFFLPLTLLFYYIAFIFEKNSNRVKNTILLIFSIIFYAWGEPVYILLMLGSITVNYVFGLLIHKYDKRWMMFLAVMLNLASLGIFKYLHFIMSNIGHLFGTTSLDKYQLPLPIGISFYTFQALSYVVDVYKKKINVQKNIFDLALYISFFPQLIAGPIVMYKDIEEELTKREVSINLFSLGIRDFVTGLGKKVIISNACASVVDSIYANNIGNLTAGAAWIGSICYLLQIYFDFGGYSDMAIGLGKMFGFHFPQNFNYPYVSLSIKEFWRRWHISLSSWFRDYLYIPLGGNRKGNVRTYINLGIVFFCTGMWHGASWNFIVWGMFHGAFMLLERGPFGRKLEKMPKAVRLVYTLFVVNIGWVFFRAPNLRDAIVYIKRMFLFDGSGTVSAGYFIDAYVICIIIIAVLLCGWLQKVCKGIFEKMYNEEYVNVLDVIICIILAVMSGILIICGTYNPFIYFQF